MTDPAADRESLTDHARQNRAYWDRTADQYQADHAPQLNIDAPTWGVWNLPEDELHILGDVAGKDVLEFGCGAAQWSIKLARRGARATGLDNSARQLEHARRLIAAAGVPVTLVHGSAERAPLPDAAFDIVFCDYGALTFTDPRLSVPEAARMLRPGGLLAFSNTGPLLQLCWPVGDDHPSPVLKEDYFGGRSFADEEGAVLFHLPYGEWIAIFRRAGLIVEDLIEPQPPADATSTYRDATHLAWARRWPAEVIWRLRKPA